MEPASTRSPTPEEHFVPQLIDDDPEAGADPSGPCPKQGSAEIGRPSERSRLSRGNSGHFIVAQFNSDPFPSQRSMWRQCMRRVLRSSAFDASITSVVFFNFVLLILDSDARAEFPGSHGEMLPPTWVARLMDFCFAFFALEFVIRLSCEGRAFFRSWMSIADMTIIVAGLLEYILLWIGSQTAGFNIIRVARLCRLVRLMRVFRLVAGLAELRRLVQMMAGCFKTLFWSSLLLCLVMTIWSVIAVELINPYIQAMVKQGAWPDCDRCRRSFASVFMSNLTLFQTVVAGNSWGLIALPVIEEHPEVVLVFAGSRMTLVFGVLNLIVAVIVDTFAENRLKDVNSIAKELDIEESNEKKTLGRIFEKIDLDGDGALSYDELVQGATKVREFAQWLRVLDIDSEDLYQLFTLVDLDGSGEIDPQEFVNAMYRMKHTESKTATKFVKHMVSRLDVKHDSAVEEMTEHMRTLESTMKGKFTEQEEALKRYSCPTYGASEREALQRKLHEQEEAFETKLREQEEGIRLALEAAVGKASEVALEAALDAAARSVEKIMRSGRGLTEGVSARMDEHRQVLADIGYDAAWVGSETSEGAARTSASRIRGPRRGASQSPQEPGCGDEALAPPLPAP